MNNLLEGKEIDKYFGSGNAKNHVLKGVSLRIQPGEFIALMGPSGSGKSTLLFSISGMDSIDDGIVLFKDRNLQELKERELSHIRRREMGFVFQNPTFLRQMSIIDNIMLPSYDDFNGSKDELKKKALRLMESIGIAHIKDRMITEVSGGELQRASICRASLHEPDILFADEPTGALNSHASQKVLDLIEDLHRKGMAILLVTHDAKVAARANRVVFMKDGSIDSTLDFNGEDFNNKLDTILKTTRDLAI